MIKFDPEKLKDLQVAGAFQARISGKFVGEFSLGNFSEEECIA